MSGSQLKLPPHLRQQSAPPETGPAEGKGRRGATPGPQTASDMVKFTTPLGSVTCPPGRIKLNWYDGGMPKRGEAEDRQD